MNEYIVVLTTVPDKIKGEEIAREILNRWLAACVTISSSCQSYYWWNEKISQDKEFILLIKTKASFYKQLEEKILELHPYDVPEIISLSLSAGHSKYLNWIDKETKEKVKKE